MFLVTVLSTLFLFIYLVMIVWLFSKLKESTESKETSLSVSIIIPFRNEVGNLPALLKCLSAQVYNGSWEMIFVNDHSDDKGVECVENFVQKEGVSNLRLIHSPKGAEGKKAALGVGKMQASGEIIVQTDADCEMGDRWLQNLINGFDETVEMVLAPVAMSGKKGFWSKFAALEFMSLQATGAAFALGNKPIMGSAANMAYRKSALTNLEIKGENISSGDDVFMIQTLASENPRKVKFVMDIKAQTYTDAPATFGEFMNQRARWGSKTTNYPSKLAIAVAGLIGGISVLLCAFVILAFWQLVFLEMLASILFVKAVADYVFLSKYARLTKQTKLLRYFTPSTVIYPFYICITGVAMLFKTSWKGRFIQK